MTRIKFSIYESRFFSLPFLQYCQNRVVHFVSILYEKYLYKSASVSVEEYFMVYFFFFSSSSLLTSPLIYCSNLALKFSNLERGLPLEFILIYKSSVNLYSFKSIKIKVMMGLSSSISLSKNSAFFLNFK